MGFFPFLAPFSPWVKQVMEDREKDPVKSILQKNPFAVLTSAALVVKGPPDIFEADSQKRKTAIKDIIGNIPGNSYKGCIIASNINDLALSYSVNETPVGIDFTGKVITVEKGTEVGRRVSTPIIESIDIDTDGANNTLKTAKVNVKCFTLKQLEMFELFFMKPGMNVLLEFGDSTLKYMSKFDKAAQPGQPVTKDTKKTYQVYQNGKIVPMGTYSNIEEALVNKKDYNLFCTKEFYKYFRSDSTGQQDYVERVESSLGSFDLIAGKVTDYNFTIEADGTYNVDIEISQGNQLTLATAHSKPTEKGKEKTQSNDIEFTPKDQIEELIASDFNLDIQIFRELMKKEGYKPDHGGEWDLDWFNFLKVNKEQQDTIASSEAYISLRFILKILMNYIIGGGNVDDAFFKLEIPKYNILGTTKEVEVIPVRSHKAMLSSSDQVIFPRNNIPTITGPVTPKKTKNSKNKQAKGENVETYNEKSDKDGRIGKKLDFHYGEDLERTPAGSKKQEIKKDLGDDYVLGNALNIFIKYETIAKHWRSTYTRMDFLEKVLNVVNQNGYGLYNLIFGVEGDNGRPAVFDHRFVPDKFITESEAESYRFKPTTINSIVKEFSFNFEMSNLVAGRTIFNSGKFLALAKEEQQKKAAAANQSSTAPAPQNQELELPAAAYKSIDNSTFGNADGWYSINNVEFERIKENFQKAKEAEEKKVKVQTEDTKTEDTTKEAQDINEVIKGKSVNFLIDEDTPKGRRVVLIYKDPAFIRNKINKKEADLNKPTVSPITVTITVDGFSGFRCGQYFNVDGIPEIYNQIGVFQITNTKHNISKEGWTTTIEAEHRIITKIKK